MQVRCENCHQPFDLPQPTLGMKAPCPHCGDVNIIRSIDAPNEDRAAAAGYPPAAGPEVTVLTVRPAMFRAHPVQFLVVAAVLLAGAAGALFFGVFAATPLLALAVGCGALSLIALGWLVVWKVKTLGDCLTVTTKRTIDREGLLSRVTSEVLHADIKNIQVKQRFWDRVFGVGIIGLSSSAENEDEIQMADVPNPHEVRRVIDLYRRL
jgi:predicted RNA-binding Zn-ribbon protein involved in translation (DUF1610 family)